MAQPLSAQTRSIDVPSESLKAALEDYIRQTGVQLLYNDAEIAGLKSSPVHGPNPPDRALDILLKGTGAVAHRDASGAVVVALRQAAKVPLQPPAQAVVARPIAWESVTVTGSRVIADIADSPTPVISISTAEMNAITPSDLPDGLNKLPIFAGSRNQRTVGGSTINWPGNFLDLRDFGFNRTLILLDGRRVPYTDSNGDVDANILPQALVSRVDIVTGGASAVYGSDAITGVVNFVIDKHFEGVKLTGETGISGYGDDASWKAGIVAGTDFDGARGHVEASYEHYVSDGIPDMLDRPLGKLIPSELGYGTAASPYFQALNTRNVQLTPGGYIATGALANRYFVGNGVLAPFVHGTPGTGVNEIGGDGGYTGESYPGAGADAWLEASLKSDQAFGRADYDISDTLHAAVQAGFSQSENYSVPFVQQLIGGHGFAADNAFLPAGAAAALLAAGQSSFTLYRSFQNEPGNPAIGLTDHWDVTAMANGVIGAWRWDAYYTYGISRLHEKSPVTVNQQLLDAALDAVTDPAGGQTVCRVSLTAAGRALYPSCQPFDAFGPTSESRAAWNYVTQPTDYIVINGMQDAGVSASGVLIDDWAGPIQASLNAEYRDVSLQNISNYSPTRKVDCAGLSVVTCDPTAVVWDGVTANLPRVSEGVSEGAVELDAPLFRDLDTLGTADLNAAARYTQYSVSGAATTWKLGSVWKLNDAVKLRTTVSRDIRAPTLNNLFAPVSANQSAFSDYLTGISNNVIVESQGNPALKPEVARTVTAGFVLAPSFLPGVTLSADWYDIGIHNVITNVSGGAASSEQVCIASGGTSPYCGLVTRPYPITNTSPANFPTVVTSQSLNSGKFTTHGIDGEVDYAADLAGLDGRLAGQIDMRLLVSYQPSLLTTTDVPGAPTTNQAGAEGPFSVASGRATYDVTYTLNPVILNLQERWHSGERRDANPTLVYLDPPLPQIFYTDLTLQWRIRPDDARGGVLFLSVQNLFDQAPSLYISPARTGAEGYAYPAPFDEDVVGRYVTAGISWTF